MKKVALTERKIQLSFNGWIIESKKGIKRQNVAKHMSFNAS
jgi:hypothetical protein